MFAAMLPLLGTVAPHLPRVLRRSCCLILVEVFEVAFFTNTFLALESIELVSGEEAGVNVDLALLVLEASLSLLDDGLIACGLRDGEREVWLPVHG